MILQSARDMDTGFVARVIQEQNLDPQPVTGFHADPYYWQENARWRRVIERYSWGAAMYLLDRDRSQAATLVLVGTIDIEAGKVSTQGGHHPITPGWYAELTNELRATMAGRVETLKIPPCFGFREADVVCDGGMNTASKKMEPACAWRDRCMALQNYSVHQNRLQEDVIKGKSPEQILQITTRLLEKAGKVIQVGPRLASGAQIRSVPRALTVAAKTVTAHPVPRTTGHLDFVAGIVKGAAEQAGAKYASDGTKDTALPGELYLLDRTARSDYISVYRASQGKPAALASFRLRARIGYVVQMPLPIGHALFEGIIQTDIKPWKDGAFQSAIKDVTPEHTNRIDHIRRILVALISSDN